MDAMFRFCLYCGIAASLTNPSWGASVKSANFTVHAPTEEFASQVAEAAEVYRRELSICWVGREMPRWYHPCPIVVKPGTMGAGGVTTFNFDGGEVNSWKMTIQGTPERILDSVLPHEVNHTILACYFRRPLPRWADEGAASVIEHDSERLRLQQLAQEAIRSGKKIPLERLLSLKDYPKDPHAVLMLYAEGYTLANYLLQRGGRGKYLQFLQTAHDSNWERAFAQHYSVRRLSDFEQAWEEWVTAGCPSLENALPVQLAESKQPAAVSKLQKSVPSGAQIRGQSPASALVDSQRREPWIDEASRLQRRSDVASPAAEKSREQLARPVLRRSVGRPDVNEIVREVPEARVVDNLTSQFFE